MRDQISEGLEGIGGPGGELRGMGTHDRLMGRVVAEQDDVLCTIQLVTGNVELQTRLFDQLVDLLVEGMFLELRQRYLDGALTRERYVDELAQLAEQCREVGLLPLPSREG